MSRQSGGAPSRAEIARGYMAAHGWQLDLEAVVPRPGADLDRVISEALSAAEVLFLWSPSAPQVENAAKHAVARALGRGLALDGARPGRPKGDEREGDEHERLVPRGAYLLSASSGASVGFGLEAAGKRILFLVPARAEIQELPRLLTQGLEGPESPWPQRVTLLLFRAEEEVLESFFQRARQRIPGLAVSRTEDLLITRLELWVGGLTPSETQAAVILLGREAAARFGDKLAAWNMDELAAAPAPLLRAMNARLALAESCTGGLIASMVTDVPGSSEYFDRGLVTYSNEAKMELLGVPEETLIAYGAVSSPTALAMAAGVVEHSRAQVGAAVTGIAGPGGGTEEKPVGTVHIAVASPGGQWVQGFRFSGTREEIKRQTAQTALHHLCRHLRQHEGVA